MTDEDAPPFWRRKRLEEMTNAEWESLCDGCARCCLVKLEEETDDGAPGPIHYTSIGCRLWKRFWYDPARRLIASPRLRQAEGGRRSSSLTVWAI